MITIFTCPKPFRDPHIGMIQRNAIRSWTLLKERPEVILASDEDGVGALCSEMGLGHIADVECSDKGTPRLDSVFREVQKAARHDILCYVNADIILLDDFVDAARHAMRMENSILIGSRTDLDVEASLDFSNPEWKSKLRSEATVNGKAMTISTDYFLFRKGFYNSLPAFLVGRPAYDNWMIWYARSLGALVIDCSSAVLAIHQNHHRTASWINASDQSEVQANRRLAGRWRGSFVLQDSNAVLSSGGLQTCRLSAMYRRMRIAFDLLRQSTRQTISGWLRPRQGAA